MAQMDPLPADAEPELAATFVTFERILAVVPNILLTMQRRAPDRWNDTLATDLEAGPRKLGDRSLTPGGWTGGKHVHPA